MIPNHLRIWKCALNLPRESIQSLTEPAHNISHLDSDHKLRTKMMCPSEIGNEIIRLMSLDSWNVSQYYAETSVSNMIFQVSWMSLMWLICIIRRNGGMVDFGWPSGFTIIAVYVLSTGTGWGPRRAVLCGMYIFAGIRFIFGWIVARNHFFHEDKRWNQWRERWAQGKGFLGIKSESFNFFIFYQCQAIANIAFMPVPLIISAENGKEQFHILEMLAMGLWVLSFTYENIADMQLVEFKKKQKKLREECKKQGKPLPPFGVMQTGLWRYCRHPNYFGEFGIWICYTLYALPSINSLTSLIPVLLLPAVAYYFLVHYTGAWMAEQGSLKRRGDHYRRYQESTNMLFPWFPKTHLD